MSCTKVEQIDVRHEPGAHIGLPLTAPTLAKNVDAKPIRMVVATPDRPKYHPLQSAFHLKQLPEGGIDVASPKPHSR